MFLQILYSFFAASITFGVLNRNLRIYQRNRGKNTVIYGMKLEPGGIPVHEKVREFEISCYSHVLTAPMPCCCCAWRKKRIVFHRPIVSVFSSSYLHVVTTVHVHSLFQCIVHTVRYIIVEHFLGPFVQGIIIHFAKRSNIWVYPNLHIYDMQFCKNGMWQ